MLPNIRRPRLCLMGNSFTKRWQESALYPAFRKTAKGYRLFVRIKAAVGFHRLYMSDNQRHWPLKVFVEKMLPDVSSIVILLGTPGPSQKAIIELWNEKGIIGYLKYAEKPIARARLKRENRILGIIPKELGPTVLKYDTLGPGQAMLITPIFGKSVPTKLPPAINVCDFFKASQNSAYLTIEEHPWIRNFKEHWGDLIDPWLDSLNYQKWSLTVQHGDPAPWNLKQTIDGTIKAIDWEYGDKHGFPFIDLAQYILQVSALIHRWKPVDAKEYAIRFLCQNNTSFGLKEAEAIVSLTSLYAYWQAQEDGHSPDAQMQTWRRKIWENN